MKYYNYISASKVEMLFPQVPHALREKVSAEIGFNLGLISGKVGSEAARSEEVVTRLQVVERYLTDSQELGTVKAPREWFSGEMSARMVGLWTHGGAVFFVGETNGVLVALGGSMRNVLGGERVSGEGPPLSHLTFLMRALEALVMDEKSTSESVTLPPVELRGTTRRDVETEFTWEELIQTIANKKKAKERVHFIARFLAKGKAQEQRVLLGTPLYVAAGSP